MLNQKTGVKQARDEVLNGYRTGLNLQNSKVNKVRNVQCITSGTHRLKQLQFCQVTSTKARAASQFNLEDKVAKVASWLLLVNNLDVNSEYIYLFLRTRKTNTI